MNILTLNEFMLKVEEVNAVKTVFSQLVTYRKALAKIGKIMSILLKYYNKYDYAFSINTVARAFEEREELVTLERLTIIDLTTGETSMKFYFILLEIRKETKKCQKLAKLNNFTLRTNL